MSFGFEATNLEGKTTISTGFPLMKFAGKCSVVSNTFGLPESSYFRIYQQWYMNYGEFKAKIGRIVLRTPFIPGANPPLVFFYIHDGGGLIMPSSITSNGDGTWTILLCTRSLYPSPEAYCFYSTGLSMSAETHGLRLFGSDGSLIFDSGWPRNIFLRVRDIKAIVAASGNSFTVEGLVKPAIAFKFNYSMTESGGAGAYDDNHKWWDLYVIVALGLSRTATAYTASAGIADLYPYSNEYRDQLVYYPGSVPFGYQDGKTHHLPIIDGADYD